mmetsp:Transcript_30099/g.55637  ORF Transcript_30099/g.55637 Transcript_30099/m.55637 type:complete len:140 (+) Transcript_30099:1-420(+)
MYHNYVQFFFIAHCMKIKAKVLTEAWPNQLCACEPISHLAASQHVTLGCLRRGLCSRRNSGLTHPTHHDVGVEAAGAGATSGFATSAFSAASSSRLADNKSLVVAVASCEHSCVSVSRSFLTQAIQDALGRTFPPNSFL